MVKNGNPTMKWESPFSTSGSLSSCLWLAFSQVPSLSPMLSVGCFEFCVAFKYPVMDERPQGAAHCQTRAICHQHEVHLCQAAGLSHVLLLMKCQYYLSPSNIYATSGCLGSEPLDRQQPSMVLYNPHPPGLSSKLGSTTSQERHLCYLQVFSIL